MIQAELDNEPSSALQHCQELLTQIQASDQETQQQKPWLAEQQTVLRARVTVLYMKLYFAKQLSSAFEYTAGFARTALTSVFKFRGVDPVTQGLTLEATYKHHEIKAILDTPTSDVPIAVDQRRQIFPLGYEPSAEPYRVDGLQPQSLAEDSWHACASRPLNFALPSPPWFKSAQPLGEPREQVPFDDLLVDVAIPVHPKDAGTVGRAVQFLRRHCSQLGDVYIIGPSEAAAPRGTIFVDEARYPLVRKAFHKEVFQQLLKLLFLRVVPSARPNTLIMDADVFWLKDVEFVDPNTGRLLYSSASILDGWSPSRTFADGGNGHVEFVAAMLGLDRSTIKEPTGTHAVVHHMVFNRGRMRLVGVVPRVDQRVACALPDTVEALFRATEARVKRNEYADNVPRPGNAWEPWMVFVELFDAHHVPRSSLYSHDPFPANLTMLQLHESSEYELYDTFIFSSGFPVTRRKLRFADIGQCCFSADGQTVAGCDTNAMHDELSTVYDLDYVACHGPFRGQAETGSGEAPVEY